MLLALLLSACAGKGDDSGVPADQCWTDLAPGDTATVATGFGDGTEGAAFVDGRLFVSVPDGVVEVLADGTTVPLATTGDALGLAPADGALLVADPGEFTLDGSGDDGRVLRVSLDGEVTVLADGLPNPNFVASTPWGTALVSDDTNETVWEVADGVATPWIEGIPSPNGLGFSPDGATVYAASTFIADPPLWAAAVTGTAAGTPTALATFPTGSTPDGLAVAADGRVLVALNLAGDLAAVDPATGAAGTLATGLDSPASLAFGEGDEWDACSVYVTSLYSDAVTRVALGFPGAPVDR